MTRIALAEHTTLEHRHKSCVGVAPKPVCGVMSRLSADGADSLRTGA